MSDISRQHLMQMRNMAHGMLVRTCQLSLQLHKEQERIEDLLKMIDILFLKDNPQEET